MAFACFEILLQYPGNKRQNLKRFFAFSNTPVDGIGNAHKIEIILNKTLKKRQNTIFLKESCLVWLSRSGDGRRSGENLGIL